MWINRFPALSLLNLTFDLLLCRRSVLIILPLFFDSSRISGLRVPRTVSV